MRGRTFETSESRFVAGSEAIVRSGNGSQLPISDGLDKQ